MPYPYGVLSPGEDAEAPSGILSNLFAGFVNRAKQPLTAFYNAASMPPEQAQQQVRDVASKVVSAAVEPVKQAGDIIKPNPYPPGTEESSWYEGQRQKAIADWAPQTALSTMGTGGIVGVPVKGAETALGAGILRRQPPLLGVYHGTGNPTEFSMVKSPPATHDLGIHSTIDPTIAEDYAYVKPSKANFLSTPPPNPAGVRVKPLVADVQNALRYPIDAGKWNHPENVIQGLEGAMRGSNFQAPRGLLSDMKNIAGSTEGWQKDFIPMLKERGYDALYYPHETTSSWKPPYNTFMTFDPEQTMPRFSPEAQTLINQRGVHEPMKSGTEGWRIPQGILKKGEMETGADLPPVDSHAGVTEMQQFWKPVFQYLKGNPHIKIPEGFNWEGKTPQGAIQAIKDYNEYGGT